MRKGKPSSKEPFEVLTEWEGYPGEDTWQMLSGLNVPDRVRN